MSNLTIKVECAHVYKFEVQRKKRVKHGKAKHSVKKVSPNMVAPYSLHSFKMELDKDIDTTKETVFETYTNNKNHAMNRYAHRYMPKKGGGVELIKTPCAENGRYVGQLNQSENSIAKALVKYESARQMLTKMLYLHKAVPLSKIAFYEAVNDKYVKAIRSWTAAEIRRVRKGIVKPIPRPEKEKWLSFTAVWTLEGVNEKGMPFLKEGHKQKDRFVLKTIKMIGVDSKGTPVFHPNDLVIVDSIVNKIRNGLVTL